MFSSQIVPLLNKVPGFHAHLPNATFYVFVNVTEAMRMTKMATLEEFRKYGIQCLPPLISC
jgi:aspartate/methionine/tyrosine aminotransferase